MATKPPSPIKAAVALTVAPVFRGGTGWMLYSYGAGLSLQAVYLLLLARGLGVSEFGKFAAALALVSVLSPFVGLGAGNVLVQHTSRDTSDFGRSLGTALLAIPASAIAIGGVLLTVARATGSDLLEVIAWLALAEMLGTRLLDLAQQSFQAFDALHGTAHISVAAAVARSTSATIFVTVGADTAASWAPVYASVTVAVAFCALTAVFVKLGRPTWPGSAWREDLRVGPFFALGQASKTVYSDIDKYMLLQYIGSAVTGAFTAAYRLVTFAFVPVQALVYANNTALFRAGALGPDASWRAVRQLWPTTIASAALGSCALLVAAPLAPHILGPGYGPTSRMLLILAALPLLQGIHYLLGDALMGLGRQSRRSVAQVVAAICNVLLNLVLIPPYSWKGAAVSTFFCEGMLGVCFFMMFRRELSGAKRA